MSGVRKLACGVVVAVLSIAALETLAVTVAATQAAGAADLNARVAAAGAGLRGPDSWGMIPRHPAVVNAVTAEPSENLLSLCGEWDFFAPKEYNNYRTACWQNMHLVSDEKRELRGKKGQAFVRKMNVPGCWEGQGFGEEGPGRGWAIVSDRSQPVLRHTWFGQAWYRRYVDIPKSWAGKRIWLKTGGVMSQGWFWVNDRQVAWWDFYCGTYKYEITDFVKPGERAKIDVMASNLSPCRRGNFVSNNHWGGITRALELEATPATLIDDAWARGDFDARTAEVHATVTGPDAKAAVVRVTVADATVEAPAAADGAETVVRVPLKDFRAWSPEHPHLYVATVELLENGRVTMTRRERFGVRKLEVCGKEFRLNGRPFYFRGAGYHNIDPVHGLRPADRAFYLSELRHVKAAGFNALRTHTRCETPEFFEACDELGLLVQPELPYYTDSPADDFRFDPVGDVIELYANYRRHPSFAVYSSGNEGSFGPDLSRRVHALIKSLDPDRLAIDQDRWGELPSDRTDYQMNFMDVWPRGSYDPDAPFLAHEYLNLAVKIDARIESKYVGVRSPPVTMKGRDEWLARFGLSRAFGERLQEAQHHLQAYWQKDGFESARNDPYCDGFYYWSLQDVAGIQGTARTAQALFTPFWDTKPGGWTEKAFAAFNSPVCVLTDVEGHPATNRVFTSGETVGLRFRVSQYGEDAVKGAVLAWRFVASDGRTLAEGRAAAGDLACGPVREVARAAVTFPDVPAAVKAVLEVRLVDAAGAAAAPANRWDFWVFPKRAPRDGSRIAAAEEWRASLAKGYPGVRPLAEMDKADVVIARHFDTETVTKARAAGKHLVTVEKIKGRPANKLGWWNISSQAGAVYAHRPEFRHFPHEGFHDALAFRLLKLSETKLPFEDLSEKDLLVAGEGAEACYFYFGEKPRTDGRKWYVAFGFDLVADLPEARAVLDGVLEQCAAGGKPAADDAVRPAAYRVLPAGAVTPCGWLRTQLELQRDGLTGHAEELYADIGQSDWLTGGKKGGDFAWERGPYYAKGLLSLAYVLDDAVLKAKAKRWAEAYLASQRPNGDFGPKNRNWWANMLVLHFMRDWYDVTGDARALAFLKRYADFQLAELPRHPLVRDSYWARARGGDNAEVALWLFDRTRDPVYLKLARLIAGQTADWTGYYTQGGDGDYGCGFRMHIVNFMQGLKAPALAWRLFGRDADRAAYAAACDADGWAMRAHGRPDRMVNGTEPLSGRSPSEGTELCAIAERILSCRDVVAACGDPLAADDLEFVAYNSLPAVLSRDGKGLRYYLSLNQPQCVTGLKFGYENNGESAAQCPGPDAGYGCCRSNFHFAWPKFVQSMWMETADGGLAAIAYGACRVTTKRATVFEEGTYPRSGNVTFRIEKADGTEWDLVLRQPLWCPRMSVAVNGAPAASATIRRAWRAGDRVEVTFEMPSVRVDCAEGAVAWTRGPLVYAHPVAEKPKSLPTAANRTGFPVTELRPASPWNWALADEDPVAVRDGVLEVRAARTSYGGWGTFRPGDPHYAARPLDPVSPVPPSASCGPLETLVLVPLSDTQLRITCFPLLGRRNGARERR